VLNQHEEANYVDTVEFIGKTLLFFIFFHNLRFCRAKSKNQAAGTLSGATPSTGATPKSGCASRIFSVFEFRSLRLGQKKCAFCSVYSVHARK